jgi:hypothetical protein
LFISHSAVNNAAAIALRDWLVEQGFDDVFLDIDPDRGLVPGERWQEALKAAADRCEAVLFVISPAWLGSRSCRVSVREEPAQTNLRADRRDGPVRPTAH